VFKKGDLVVYRHRPSKCKGKNLPQELPYVILDPKGIYDGFAQAMRADGKIEQICMGSFILAVG